MRRRDFVTFLSGATAWAAAARAQKPRRVIGVLGSASYGTLPGTEASFQTVGFIEGKNISIEWPWAEGQYDRLSSLAGVLST
jgi:putative tryptophan/tyrosine transport system substrate-binding protein